MPVPSACARPAAVLLAALAVLACQPKRGTEPVADGTADPQRASPSSGSPADGSQTARVPDGRAADDESGPAEATGRDATQPQPIDANPQRMLGANAEGLAARLGTPTQRRREASARVWQYRLKTCVLDVVLYPEAGTPVVAHLEARNRNGAPVPTQRCLERVLNQRAAAQTGEDGP